MRVQMIGTVFAPDLLGRHIVPTILPPPPGPQGLYRRIWHLERRSKEERGTLLGGALLDPPGDVRDAVDGNDVVPAGVGDV